MDGPNFGLTNRELELTVKAMITMVENKLKVSKRRTSHHFHFRLPHLVGGISFIQNVGARD